MRKSARPVQTKVLDDVWRTRNWASPWLFLELLGERAERGWCAKPAGLGED